MAINRRFLKSVSGLLLLTCLLLSTGCITAFLAGNGRDVGHEDILQIGMLISRAYDATCREFNKKDSSEEPLPSYLEALIADGKITVGLGIGTEDLGKLSLPHREEEYISRAEYIIFGKSVLIEGRLILTKHDFRRALSECEIIFVTTHSRFGAGPVFLKDGKADPFTMQQTKNYEIIMPQSEVSGYQGTIKRIYHEPLKKRTYVVFEPDATDLERSYCLHGYQMLIFSTCTSKKHFLDEIVAFRGYYPTTAIFTTRPCCMDPEMRIFMRCLYEIFQGKSIGEVVAGMNEEYRHVSWEKVHKRIHSWKVISKLYTVGINNVP